MKISIVFTCIALLLFGFTAYAQTNWQLYDNFNSAQIDSSKWETDDSSATITVENGRAKFDLPMTPATCFSSRTQKRSLA